MALDSDPLASKDRLTSLLATATSQEAEAADIALFTRLDAVEVSDENLDTEAGRLIANALSD